MRKLKNNKDSLLLKQPAAWWHDTWREGLVSGNGIIGANVYGGTRLETILINHGELWHSGKEDEVPDVHETLEETRKLMDEKQFQDASWNLTNALTRKGYQTKLSSFLPMADLTIQITPHEAFSHFRRGISMSTGEVSSTWKEGEICFRKDLFVSRADNVIVCKIESDRLMKEVTLRLDMHINYEIPKEECNHILESKQTVVSEHELYYKACNDDGQDYGVVVSVIAPNISKVPKEEAIRIMDSKQILLLVKPFVKMKYEKGWKETSEYLKTLPFNYDSLLVRHTKIHKPLYKSAEICLYDGKDHNVQKLLEEAYDSFTSLELIEKMWHYGRYLFISGTSDKGLPFPLYGLWGGDYNLLWSHNMANENIQMIYWHTNVGGLSEFNKSLFGYYQEKIPKFQEYARKLYGCRGIYMTAGTTPTTTAPNQVVPVIINWVGAAAWIGQHYYQHYLFLQDKDFLKEYVIPYLNEVALFYEDFLCFDEENKIKLYPSVSPENTPSNFMPSAEILMAHPMPTTINSTIDLALVKEVFTNLLQIQQDVPEKFSKTRVKLWQKILRAIPEYDTNSEGAVREWQCELFEDRYDHRHLSHLYPVFPGYEIGGDSPLFDHFKKAVSLRKIDTQTGWSMVHMACIYARLKDGEKAMKSLDMLAKSTLLPNLFTLHNDWRNMNISLNTKEAPVQLDAAVGYVNAVQEMIIYVNGNYIELLPALPKAMKSGKVKNLCFPGGKISFQWNIKDNYFSGKITGLVENNITVKLPEFCGGNEIEISLSKDVKYIL